MKPAARFLAQQRKSREKLRQAVSRYVNLRAGDGSYETTVRTTDREGRPVTVFVRLDIIAGEE